jgi:hypothetical protein
VSAAAGGGGARNGCGLFTAGPAQFDPVANRIDADLPGFLD